MIQVYRAQLIPFKTIEPLGPITLFPFRTPSQGLRAAPPRLSIPMEQMMQSFIPERHALINKLFLFDTGMLSIFKASRAGEAERNFWNDVFARNFLMDASMQRGFISVQIHTTAIMLLEFLGITLEKIDPVPEMQDRIRAILSRATADNALKVFEEVQELILPAVQDHPLLSMPRLRSRFDEQRGWFGKSGKHHVDAAFEAAIRDDDFHEHLIHSIVWDRLQTIDIRTLTENSQACPAILLGLLGTMFTAWRNSHTNASFVRFADQIIRRYSVNQKSEILGPYRTDGDGLDTEIVHLALFGGRHEGVQTPVMIFTTESLNCYRLRLERFVDLLAHADLVWNQKGEKFIEPVPGLIFQVDSRTGHILGEPINVGRDFCAGRFRK